jgi:hypothetical protein
MTSNLNLTCAVVIVFLYYINISSISFYSIDTGAHYQLVGPSNLLALLVIHVPGTSTGIVSLMTKGASIKRNFQTSWQYEDN